MLCRIDRRHLILGVILAGRLLVRSGLAADGGALPSLPDELKSELELEIPEVEMLPKESSVGPDVFAYRITMPKGVRFFVAIKEYPAADKRPVYCGYWHFENETDDPVPFTIRLERNNGTASALLSQDEYVTVRVKAKHAHPGAFVTEIEVPLRDLPPDKKQLVAPETNEDARSRGPGFRRMLIVAKAGVKLDKPVKVFPRAEMIVGRVPPEPKKTAGPPSLMTLAARAQFQMRAIGTANIRYRQFTWRAEKFTVRDPEAIREAFLTTNLLDHPDRLNKIYERLAGEKPQGNAWNVRRFQCVGLKTRDESIEGRLTGSMQIYDGEFIFAFGVLMPHLSVHAPATARIGITRFDDFRRLLPQSHWKAEVQEDRHDGRLTVPRGEGEIIMDEQTGFIHRWTGVRKGQISSETLQRGPQEYTGGIRFPKVHIEIRYLDGQASLIRGQIVEQAKFNEPFAADTFRMSVPKGTTVVDYRKDNFRPRVYRLQEEVPDMAARLKKGTPD